MVGIPSRAPARVTASDAATTARRAASGRSRPAARPAASAPLSASPAPTVSTASTRGAWIARARRPATSIAPRRPRLTSAARLPGSAPSSLRPAADGEPSGPTRTASSPSFGVRMSARSSVERPRPVAGAGLRIVVAPAILARRSASCVAPVRISCPTSTTSPAVKGQPLERRPHLHGGQGHVRAAGHRDPVLALGVDHDERDPGRLAGEGQDAGHVDPFRLERRARIGAEAVLADRADERGRRPEARRRDGLVRRPCRRGACAWRPPITVSPGPGSRSTVTTRSTLIEPTTMTRPLTARPTSP